MNTKEELINFAKEVDNNIEIDMSKLELDLEELEKVAGGNGSGRSLFWYKCMFNHCMVKNNEKMAARILRDMKKDYPNERITMIFIEQFKYKFGYDPTV